MIFNTIYIISYFGEEKELRDFRIKVHQEQINKILSFTHKFNIVIFAQKYNHSDYIEHPQISYVIRTGELLRPGEARNVLKKYFYESNEDYALFLDNDVLLTDEYIEVITKYENQLKKCFEEYKIGLLSVQYDNKQSLRIDNSIEYISSHPNLKEQHKNPVLYLADRTTPEAMYIMKNFRKFENTEFFYDPKISFSMGKDFLCSLLSCGHKTYYFWRLNNNLNGLFDEGKSTIAKYRKEINNSNSEFTKSRIYFFHKWCRILNIPFRGISLKDIYDILITIQSRCIDFKKQPYKIVLEEDIKTYLLQDVKNEC